MYAWRNIRDKHPNQIAVAFVAAFNFIAAIVLEATGYEIPPSISLSGETFLMAGLALFIASKTANKAVLDAVADTTEVAAQSAARETVKALRPRPLRAPPG